MEHRHLVRISKRMSLALRHRPDRFGLTLDTAGRVPVTDLLGALDLTRAELDAVVAGDDKQRFALYRDAAGTDWIRASQGHSVPVDLGLAVRTPPDVLYHGTAASSWDSIRATGLHRARRHHVHLSADPATAHRVGARRAGPTVVITVDAAAMVADGHLFQRSDNGVWLTAAVPPCYLTAPG